MLNIKKILLPVDFPNTSLPVVHQAATLAHHFHSEIVMLHVVTARSHAAGVPEDGPALAGWDMLAEMVRGAQKNLDQSLGLELEGLPIRCALVKGDPAQAILQTAQLENADLIMMPSHGYTFDQFLLGSVTAKVLHRTECPVWTGAHVESSVHEFAIRNVLCAVDLGPRSRKTVSWAAQMASEFGARLARQPKRFDGAAQVAAVEAGAHSEYRGDLTVGAQRLPPRAVGQPHAIGVRALRAERERCSERAKRERPS